MKIKWRYAFSREIVNILVQVEHNNVNAILLIKEWVNKIIKPLAN